MICIHQEIKKNYGQKIGLSLRAADELHDHRLHVEIGVPRVAGHLAEGVQRRLRDRLVIGHGIEDGAQEGLHVAHVPS